MTTTRKQEGPLYGNAASATGETVPRRRVGETIIVPFDDISDGGPDPIRVARLSPEPAPAPAGSNDETLLRRELPAKVEPRLPAKSVWSAIRAVPEWAWVVAAMALFALGSFGVMLVGLAIALYVYMT